MPRQSPLSRAFRPALVALSGLILGAAPRAAAQTPVEDVGIDHLILGIDDLARGMAEFAKRTGVTPIKGGVHPGKGTQNALASLSDGRYVEILAPSGEPGVAADPRTAHRALTPVGWALHTRELSAVAARVRAAGIEMSEIRPGARARPDGSRLSWQTAEPSGRGLEAAPFFISWGAGTPHPSTESPTGCRLRSVVMSEPDPAPLTHFLTSVALDVAVRRGATRQMQVTLTCPTGVVEFR